MAQPLKAALVGLTQDNYPQVSRVLEACSINAAEKYPDARSAVDNIRLAQGEALLSFMYVSSEQQLSQVKYLRETFVGRPIITLVDEDSDPNLFLLVSQLAGGPILRLPLETEDLEVALRCVKASHSTPLPVSTRRVIAVTGVAGGCGATTLAVNLAYELTTQFGLSCILMDFACGGIVSLCLEVEVKYTLADLLGDMRSADAQVVEQMLVPITDRFRIFPAPRMEDEPLRASPEDVVHVLNLVKQLADVVILDLPLHNDVRFEAYSGVNQALLVAEQTVPALRALSNAQQVLNPIEGLRQTLVINRYNPRLEGFTVSHLQRLLKTSQLVSVANDYAAVTGSINAGMPLRLYAPSSRVLGDIHNLAKMQVTPGFQPQIPPDKRATGLNWLIKALVS